MLNFVFFEIGFLIVDDTSIELMLNWHSSFGFCASEGGVKGSVKRLVKSLNWILNRPLTGP